MQDLDDLEFAEIATEPAAAAAAAGLRYVSDEEVPGLHRRRCGAGFVYLRPDGSRLPTRSDDRMRIEELAIPPAWTDVWICPVPEGHIQATGRDDRGRKQYLYHERWGEIRSEAKFNRMLPFGLALPRIRQRVDQDLRLRGPRRERVLAVVVHLLQDSLIRVGNLQYANENHSFGLTTLHTRHVLVKGDRLRFRFRGKSGRLRDLSLRHPRLARAVATCRELPGHPLFQYRDEDGRLHPVDSGDVNEYLRVSSGEEFTAKDFRTWGGTVTALEELHAAGWEERPAPRKRAMNAAIRATAERLGNTPAVCRQHYIHPAILAAYEEGTLSAAVAAAEAGHREQPFGLSASEEAVLLVVSRGMAEPVRGNSPCPGQEPPPTRRTRGQALTRSILPPPG